MTKDVEPEAKAAASVVGCLSLLALLPVSCFVDAFVFRTLWAWFVVPQFHVAPLSLAMAMGIDTTVLLFRTVPTVPPKSKTEDDAWQAQSWFRVMARPAVVLLLGWAVHVLGMT